MNKIIEEVGKVCLTGAGSWNKNKEYETLSIVTDDITKASYFSKQDVPAGIDITNENYWQPIASHTGRNSNFIVLCDRDKETNEIIVYDLNSAINSIDEKDRNPGLILGFYGIDYSVNTYTKTWFLYQFDSENVEDWTDLNKWVSLYNNVNKFRGFYINESDLIKYAVKPTVGDHAFVGEDMEHAVFYICLETNKWTNTETPAYEFANLYEAVGSKDFDDFDYIIDEKYCDRAEKDAIGRIIHFTYITREGLSNYVFQKIHEILSETEPNDGSIQLKHLSKSLVDYINTISDGGDVINMPDEEDLTNVKVNNVDNLKFKDKVYAPNNFSGKGRKYLRKNIVDGINVLESYMITEANTIYIIQYDYCLNGATITIPENSVLQFDGGTINGGVIVLNNTKVVGIISQEDMGINLTFKGTYVKGQQFFDYNTNKPIWWNGTTWISLSTRDFDDSLFDKLDSLPTNDELNEKLENKTDKELSDTLAIEISHKIGKEEYDSITKAIDTKANKEETELLRLEISNKANKDYVNDVVSNINVLSSTVLQKADIEAVETLRNRTAKLENHTDILTEKTKVIETDIADKVSVLEFSTLTNKTDLLETKVNNKVNVSDFETISGKTAILETKVTELETKNTTLNEKVQANSSYLVALNDRTSAIEETVNQQRPGFDDELTNKN